MSPRNCEIKHDLWQSLLVFALGLRLGMECPAPGTTCASVWSYLCDGGDSMMVQCSELPTELATVLRGMARVRLCQLSRELIQVLFPTSLHSPLPTPPPRNRGHQTERPPSPPHRHPPVPLRATPARNRTHPPRPLLPRSRRLLPRPTTKLPSHQPLRILRRKPGPVSVCV